MVILEAFGHTKTTQNISASKYGMFQELQFSERGRILGAKTLTYAFDKSRVTQIPKEERTFNVFYSLLAGTSQEEQVALHINFPPESFNYLAQSKAIKVPEINDEIAFADLKSSLKICGFKAKTVTQIFQLLAAILHLGNLQFQDDQDNSNQAQEACCVRNHDVLETVAVILGVSPTKLEQSLTYKLRLIRKELCTMFLNTQGAAEQRDALSRALYHVLFLWIVESLNTKICYNDAEPANFVGFLDQFGFQNFKSNGFEEFCANFANERVNQFIIDQRFNDSDGLAGAMLRDGVPLPKINILDNSACLDLLIGKEQDNLKNVNKSAALGLGGIIGAMDRDCAKYQTGATDATNANFLANVQRTYGSHPSFSKSGHAYSFGVNHFSGSVHYTVDYFLEKNLDDLSPDFVSLLRDNSTNSFVSTLFESSAMATESHPKDDRTIVKAQLTSKPTRAPSMKRPNKRRNNTVRDPNAEAGEPEAEDMRKQKLIHDAEDAYQNMQVTTVMDQLYMTLRDLFYSMSDTRIYNIIHIRPNDTQSPDVFDPKRVKAQVRSFLLPDLTFKSTVDYANYYTFNEFLLRYENFVTSLQIDHTKSERDQVDNVRTMMNWVEPQAFVGHDMIWFSYETWKELEDGLRAAEKEERDRAKGLDAKQELPHEQHMLNNSSPGAAGAGGAGVAAGYYQDDRLLPPNAGYMNMNPGRTFDGASYMESEDGMKRDMEGSQWGEESEWGMKGLSDG